MQHYIDLSFPSSRVPGVGDDEVDVTFKLGDWFEKNLICEKLVAGFGPEPSCVVRCLRKAAHDSEASQTGTIYVSCVSQKYTTKFEIFLEYFASSKQAFCHCQKSIPGEIASEVAEVVSKTLDGLKEIEIYALCKSIGKKLDHKPVTFLKIWNNQKSEGFDQLQFTEMIDSLAAAFGTFALQFSLESCVTLMHKQFIEFEKGLVQQTLSSTNYSSQSVYFETAIENTMPVDLNKFDTLYM